MEINMFAVVAAALSTFLIGGLWYSPMLFQKQWMAANGFTQDDLNKGSNSLIFGLSFVFSLIMAYSLAAFLARPEVNLLFGTVAGALTGVCWVALGITVIALFERRPWTYILVNGGYWAVSFTVMGAIIGGWR